MKRTLSAALLATAALLLLAGGAYAQARSPFGVGISEGGGPAGGLAGWLLATQAGLERQLSAAVRAVATDNTALAGLLALSFGYGVFHAAGPGHGKAVIGSYLFANERALRRGLVLAVLAALLQGLVAVLLVGLMALVLNETAQRMREVASVVESASFAAVALLGAWLVWRKGRLLLAAVRHAREADLGLAFAPAMALTASGAGDRSMLSAPPRPVWRATGDANADPACGCGHLHAPDPALLGEGFSWRGAAGVVLAAGSRPCSGAILVLVFATTQGLFWAGVLAVLAMSAGTALTTGGLAALAVLARGAALRLARPDAGAGLVLLRTLEVLAGAVVLVAGLSLLAGSARLGGG